MEGEAGGEAGCLIKIIARGFVSWKGRGGKAISRSVFGLALVRYQFRGINKRNKTRPGRFTG